MMMNNDVETGVLINRTWNNENGKLYLTFEITDPVMIQLMRKNFKVRLIVEKEEEE
jgi:hypothetical protein